MRNGVFHDKGREGEAERGEGGMVGKARQAVLAAFLSG